MAPVPNCGPLVKANLFFLQILLSLLGCFYAILIGFLPICQLLQFFVHCNIIEGQILEGDLTTESCVKMNKINK